MMNLRPLKVCPVIPRAVKDGVAKSDHNTVFQLSSCACATAYRILAHSGQPAWARPEDASTCDVFPSVSGLRHHLCGGWDGCLTCNHSVILSLILLA